MSPQTFVSSPALSLSPVPLALCLSLGFCLDYTFHIVSAHRVATLRLEEDDCVWVDWSSAASIAQRLQYGERRRVLMHAWLNCVQWDATWKVCEVYTSVSESHSEVRADVETVRLILYFENVIENPTFVLWILQLHFKITSHTQAELSSWMT